MEKKVRVPLTKKKYKIMQKKKKVIFNENVLFIKIILKVHEL